MQSAARVTLLERTSTVSECQFMAPLYSQLRDKSALPEDPLTQALCTDEMKLEQSRICKRAPDNVGSPWRLHEAKGTQEAQPFLRKPTGSALGLTAEV